jgi:hypothetical protein
VAIVIWLAINVLPRLLAVRPLVGMAVLHLLGLNVLLLLVPNPTVLPKTTTGASQVAVIVIVLVIVLAGAAAIHVVKCRHQAK